MENQETKEVQEKKMSTAVGLTVFVGIMAIVVCIVCLFIKMVA